MAALTGDRATKERKSEIVELPPHAGATIYRGGMTAINAAGEALRPQDAGATAVIGRAENSTWEALQQPAMPQGALPGGNVIAGGVPNIRIRRNAQFAYANSTGGDLIDWSCYGATVYAVDDQTVAKTSNSGARLAAGICRGVDANGVWVQFA